MSDYYTNISKLNEIESFKPNWNGYNANLISPSLINTIRFLLANINVQPELFATAANTIQFEFSNEDGEYLEFEFFENGKTSVLIREKLISTLQKDSQQISTK